jgi:hypothetical protein
MKEIIFDNFQKVWSRFRQFFNFSKIYHGPPFFDPMVVCGSPPIAFEQSSLKVIVLMKEIGIVWYGMVWYGMV